MKLVIDWKGETNSFTSKRGSQVILYVLYVRVRGEPYPVRVELFDNPGKPAGVYEVPAKIGLSMDRRRLDVQLDWAAADPYKAGG